MKILAYVVAATIFEAVGDAVMRVALRAPYALASFLLTLYGLFLNLAPVEFATVTGIYLASLFIAFQIVNFLFFRHFPSAGVLFWGPFIVAGAAIIYFWNRQMCSIPNRI